MRIVLTDEHARRMAAKAINASKAVGLGFLHLDKNQEATMDDIHIVDGAIHIDYYQGRMVKFHARKVDDQTWIFHPDTLSQDYQSWSRTYPTWEMLFEATKMVV